jgi:hypothetical protein
VRGGFFSKGLDLFSKEGHDISNENTVNQNNKHKRINVMKNIYKIFGIIALSAVIWFTFSACNRGSSSSDRSSSGGSGGGSTSVRYNIGDTGPGGGKIFYYSAAGFTMTDNNQVCHYLEAAPLDLGTPAWGGASSTLIPGITTFTARTDQLAGKIGNGRRDTRLIVTSLGTKESGRAAQAASAATFGGRNDWFLPSYGELQLLYENRASVGNLGTGYYWSSSQYGETNAWRQRFSDGLQSYSVKFSTLSVRAVRAF